LNLLLATFIRCTNSLNVGRISQNMWKRCFSSFPPPPKCAQRRVVVTGLGLVSPLGVGVDTCFSKLIQGECAIDTIASFDTAGLTCKIAAQVPRGVGKDHFNAEDWIDKRSHSSQNVDFISFAMSAASQAIRDADWNPPSDERDRAVSYSKKSKSSYITHY
jgi:3-oxoacyl-(acyl-carrier-protein) synthase